jgi:SRSO17 transposase
MGHRSASSPQEKRFAAYTDDLAKAAGHADRSVPLKAYCAGLLLPGERKSVEPMAARLAPDNVRRTHQSLHHLVADAPWRDEAVLGRVREHVLPAMQRNGAVAAWIVDDTGFPKKGTHSVGVARQYCGQVGKQDNCQVAVSLSVATHHASLPIAWRLYLPESWASDRERRQATGVPEAISFQTKPALALAQIRQTVAQGVPPAPVLADSAYGNETRDAKHQPVSVKALALALPAHAWKIVTWRAGTRQKLQSRFAVVRVRPAHRDQQRSEPYPEEWLLIEWPSGETEPAKYWLSTLPAQTPMTALVRLAKHRWIIERDYQELKQELGLGHYEGRGWRGFHHHATLCIAAYGFLVIERSRFSPSAHPGQLELRAAKIPPYFQPRGSPDARRTA